MQSAKGFRSDRATEGRSGGHELLPSANEITTTGLHADPIYARPARYEIGVWYPGWGAPGTSEYESTRENLATIDKISPYWYALKSNGSIAAYGWAEDPKLLSLARDKSKLVVPLVTNEFDPSRVGRMLATTSSRDAHAEELADLVVRKGYAGLDLDYELLHAEDRDGFSTFVEDLALRLHARGKELSVAVHPKTSEPGAWDGPKAQDWGRLGRAVDEFRVMTYDYHWDGSEAGPASPPEWIDWVLDFAENQVDPQKVRMGLPFYGRDWRGTEAEDLVYAQVRTLSDRYSVTAHRDPSGEPY